MNYIEVIRQSHIFRIYCVLPENDHVCRYMS